MLRRWAHISTYTDVANAHNRIDDATLAASTPELDDDPVALYLGYYDCATLRQL
jgi:hypothetical protein